MKGLALLKDLNMPRKECKILIDCIRQGFKNVIGTSINYRDRIIALVIGLLEIMQLQEKGDNPHENYWNSSRKPQILLMAPKKHMAIEARKMFLQIGRFYELYCQALIGGMPSYQCVRRLSGGIDIICGTPGKLGEMVSRGVINKHKLENLVAFAMDGANELAGSESMKRQVRHVVSLSSLFIRNIPIQKH